MKWQANCEQQIREDAKGKESGILKCDPDFAWRQSSSTRIPSTQLVSGVRLEPGISWTGTRISKHYDTASGWLLDEAICVCVI
jgi:hypothetical protein